MKKCEKCNHIYDDSMSFCMNCGGKLCESDESFANEKPSPLEVVEKKTFDIGLIKKLIPIFIVVFVLIVILIVSISDSSEINKSKSAVEESRIQRMLSEPALYDLKINDFNVTYSSSYTTIKGTVTNVSSNKDIDYYKIKAKYYSGGAVEETDWTNGTDLGPGETQSFEIMTKGFWTKNEVKLSVEEVS